MDRRVFLTTREDAAGPVKSGRTSVSSTPGPTTPRDLDNDNNHDPQGGEDEDDMPAEDAEQMQNTMDRFSLATYQDTTARGPIDSASSFFGQNCKRDFSYLALNPDHKNRPIWIDPQRGRIILENFSPIADKAKDFLITIAEPLSRPTFLHEYALTTHSLYAAVSVGLFPDDIINTLERFSKTPLPLSIERFIRTCSASYGKVKLVIKDNRYLVESTDADILQRLLKDPVIGPCRVHGSDAITSAPTTRGLVIPGTSNAAGVQQAAVQPLDKLDQSGQHDSASNAQSEKAGEPYSILRDEDDQDPEEAVYSFEIPDTAVEKVQKRCLELQFPMLEEYDFRNDDRNANLEIDLRPATQIRSYQEKSLSKMFGSGRAKSGIIVLPCGAGKTLVGITAACTIKKGAIVLCTSTMSAHQWRQEFLKWCNIRPEDIAVFTADNKQRFPGNTGIIVTTYPMVTQSGKRAHDSQKMMDFLTEREWGLMLLDEVHVVPANIFRKV